MSSSNVLKKVTSGDNPIPIGNSDFVTKFLEIQQAGSPEKRLIKNMEDRFQIEKESAININRSEGYAKGLEDGRAEANQIKIQLNSIITEIVAYKNNLLNNAKPQLFELSFAIAEKIIGAHAESSKEIVLETIDKCISEILDKSKIKIRVSQQQFEFVKNEIDTIRAGDDDLSSIKIESDRRVTNGGCVIENDSGSADARLEKQLEILKQKLSNG